MDYIEISQGVSICIDKIECIESNPDGMTCMVITGWNRYKSTFPYNVLLELTQKKEVPERKEELNILKTLGSFAG